MQSATAASRYDCLATAVALHHAVRRAPPPVVASHVDMRDDGVQVSWNVDMDPTRVRSEQRGAQRFPDR
jgi:hypothetical protein